MGDFKTCDIHGKEFPANLIDTTKTDMSKLYIEQTKMIEGKKVNLTLFVGKNENEGADICHACMVEKLIKTLQSMGAETSWKNVQWQSQDIQRQDGSGTYKKNTKIVKTVDELSLEFKAEAEKKKLAVPAK